ncbi:hypothetical protein FB567DRAFT_603108 [Paraphoma chrysanthemicola]|uniref:Uncharacterized protein n=1 Tax=Paraphoma chrysanthemicola TaxID=798071 RepID=A0A8K0R5G7_9PLEO|nr:hypothetical protein FB567DRAFT_603108 [Paraphoma chrysanthemicola]
MATSPSPGLDLADDGQTEADLTDELRRYFGNNEFFKTTLPLLVEHFQRTALTQFQDRHPWIVTFTTSEPNLAEAQEKFLSNGSQCISSLERFAKLLRIAEGNDFLICDSLDQYVAFISRLYDLRCNYNMESIGPSSKASEDIEKRQKLERAQKFERIMTFHGEISSQHPFFQEAKAVFLKQAPLTFTHRDSIVWYDHCLQASERSSIHEGLAGYEVYETSKNLRKALLQYEEKFNEGLTRSSPWKLLTANLRDFAHYIGCPKAYDAPKGTIAAMRLFNSTQMPFFQKLQNDLEDQKRINNKQQEIITALVFRHLTESLPPQPYKGHTDSTKRWQVFWTDAIKKESQDKALNTHPLTHVHNYFSGTKRVVGASGQGTDKSQEGMKGNLYRAGEELFGTLSTNIHKYGKGGIKTLPVHFKDGEVDWDMDRTRRRILKDS